MFKDLKKNLQQEFILDQKLKDFEKSAKELSFAVALNSVQVENIEEFEKHVFEDYELLFNQMEEFLYEKNTKKIVNTLENVAECIGYYGYAQILPIWAKHMIDEKGLEYLGYKINDAGDLVDKKNSLPVRTEDLLKYLNFDEEKQFKRYESIFTTVQFAFWQRIDFLQDHFPQDDDSLTNLKGLEVEGHKIVLLHELGIIDYLREKYFGLTGKGNDMSKLLHNITGIDASTLRRGLQTYKMKGRKGNVYTMPAIVKVNKILIDVKLPPLDIPKEEM